jgi:hypothetical protein
VRGMGRWFYAGTHRADCGCRLAGAWKYSELTTLAACAQSPPSFPQAAEPCVASRGAPLTYLSAATGGRVRGGDACPR